VTSKRMEKGKGGGTRHHPGMVHAIDHTRGKMTGIASWETRLIPQEGKHLYGGTRERNKGRKGVKGKPPFILNVEAKYKRGKAKRKKKRSMLKENIWEKRFRVEV